MEHLRRTSFAALVALIALGAGCDTESDSTDEIIEETAEGRAEYLDERDDQIDEIEKGADLMGGSFERVTDDLEREAEAAHEAAEEEADRLEESAK